MAPAALRFAGMVLGGLVVEALWRLKRERERKGDREHELRWTVEDLRQQLWELQRGKSPQPASDPEESGPLKPWPSEQPS